MRELSDYSSEVETVTKILLSKQMQNNAEVLGEEYFQAI